MRVAEVTPYAWEIDDSDTYSPWLCRDAAVAAAKVEAGKRVVTLYADPKDVASPTRQQRADSERAQTIIRDAEAMAALRKIRRLSGVGGGYTLAAVAEALERRLTQ